MKPTTLLLATAALATGIACNQADAPAGADAPPHTESGAPHTDEASAHSPGSASQGAGDHPAQAMLADHADHGDHTAHESAAEHADHAPGSDETESTLAAGEYDPAELVDQPSATIGDITTCPVSGDVFLVTEDTPYFDRGGERFFFSSPARVRRFQRDPDSYLAAAANAPGGPTVEVAAGGSRFDPPVSRDRIPTGNWICDMGTVHYASSDPGDGSCPVCGMFLAEH